MSSQVFRIPIPRGAYPEREVPRLSWLDETGERAAGVLLRRLRASRRVGHRIVAMTAELSGAMERLGDLELRQQAKELRLPLRREGFRDPLVARVFALVREAARRTIGQRHYDVQILGGSVLLRGLVAEMETGEGKTLTATLAASTAALAGIPVHIVTVNDYLVERDAHDMGPIFRALGLSVGAIKQGMTPGERRASYACDVTYCSNKELVFDYLKDCLALGRQRSRARLQLELLREGSSRADRLLLRGLCFGIVDEADSVLIDEARTPLIISGRDQEDGEGLEHEVYRTAMSLAERLVEGAHFRIDPRERRVHLTPQGEARVRKLTRHLGGVWSGRRRGEDFLCQALTALHLFKRDQHYLVTEGKVQIVDEYTGRVMADRSWERGLHQMIEVKEGCDTTREVKPLARISYQRFFRRYLRLAGMTGTAREVAGELGSVYRLPVVRIPTNRPLRRQDVGDRVYRSAEEKWQATLGRIQEVHRLGRPVLVGTRSVAASEHLSALLSEAGLEHRVLNARQDREEAQIIAQAGQARRITVATNMAGRGTDITLFRETAEAGGLHVIATERHEARRIDRQLVGRAGRQGDPGSYELMTSLEDDLVRAHGWTFWSSKPGSDLADRGTATSRLRRAILRQAQRRAERLHSRTRRKLVKMDERIATMLAFSGKGE
jgi:preprotein translocase subunit SecA